MSWTRNDSIELGKLALQAGFSDVDEAREALEIGAKLKAYGVSPMELEALLLEIYFRA